MSSTLATSVPPAEPVMTAAAEPEPALVCRDVQVSFRNQTIVYEVNLDLGTSEWLGIIGPNGAGKSTLLRAIAGLNSHSGTIHCGGGHTPGATDVALVPQSPVMPTGMTVVEYVLLGRTAHLGWLARESKLDRQVVSSVLQRLELSMFANRMVSTLSGGEAQQVVVARALAQQCPVLLLDEPTSALDVGHQVSVLELVDDLRHTEGLSVIAAMHDLSTAARFADRLIFINHGRIEAQGSPVNVLKPDLLSFVYGTPLTVQSIHGELVVLPAARRHKSSSHSQPYSNKTREETS
ncbi:MAG: ABC transporter ATP-binding protein [bacterium]|nr:ABC transporter ATP-binding protein [bacterium]